MQATRTKDRDHRALRWRRGAAAVEAAMVLPIVLLFLMGILEYGRYVMTLQVLTNAAREGAHYALSHTAPVTLQGVTYGNSTSDVVSAVNNASGGQSLTDQTISVYASDTLGNNLGSWTDASSGESVCVKISGTYYFVLPSLLHLPSSMPVETMAVMRSEGN